MRIVYSNPGGPWAVITVAVRLAARLLEAELIELPMARTRHSARRYASLLPRRRGSDTLLVVAPEPADLVATLIPSHWLRGYGVVAGWVIDSWWDDRIPRVARGGRHLDLLYGSEDENLDVWRERTGVDVRWLPTGTNALDWGTPQATRPVTLQRVGRQPTAWDDDAANARLLAEHELRYAGRPPFLGDPEAGMRDLMARYARARFSLAFSNRHSPAGYTHPTREYLTGRWCDALASGATVAGIAPRTRSTAQLLWDGALLEFPTVEPQVAIETLRRADEAWTPAVAERNHRMALERLDWRWRIATIAQDLGVRSPTLDAEMQRLTLAIERAG